MPLSSGSAGYLGITWQIGVPSGWGVYGYQIVQALLRRERLRPVMFNASSVLPRHPLMDERLEEVRKLHGEAIEALKHSDGTPLRVPYPVLHALGNDLGGGSLEKLVLGEPDVGLVFLEDTTLTPLALERAVRYRTIVAGSGWNGEVLRGAGLTNVAVCPQGIDPTIFHPAPRSGMLRDRFVIFSGGKLEHRKGQDIVVEAFRRFHARHPEALLVAVWHNHWPQTAIGISKTRWAKAPLTLDAEGRLRVADWLSAQGLPEGSFRVVPAVAQMLGAAILREADAALFPNRCEGGTNLVAMEALACGVPTILSANTGHLDLIHDVPCYALTRQDPVPEAEAGMGTQGWGESSIEEILEHLEAIHADRQSAAVRGLAAAARMQEAWNWDRRISDVMTVVSNGALPTATAARG